MLSFSRLITLQAEQNSVSELTLVLTRTIEALSFILLLNDYRLGDLINQLVFSIEFFFLLTSVDVNLIFKIWLHPSPTKIS